MQSTDLPVVPITTLNAKPIHLSPARTLDRAVSVPRTAATGLAAVYLLVAYEWLISGFNKLLNADFTSGLSKELEDGLADNPNHWYVHLVRRFVLPHAETMAVLVQWAELAVGLGLLLGAVRLVAGTRLNPTVARLFDVALIGALVGSALMALNYWFMAGNALPWVNAAHAFDEGISLDGLLALGSLTLLVVHLRALRAPQIEA